MRLVVDAMNVIGSVPDGWWRDRDGAVERLVAALEGYAAARARERVTVVLERQPRHPLDAERVEVLWAPEPGRDAADDEIVRRLPGWAEEGEVTVVTSDRGLAARAEGAGAAVRPARAFRRTLSY